MIARVRYIRNSTHIFKFSCKLENQSIINSINNIAHLRVSKGYPQGYTLGYQRERKLDGMIFQYLLLGRSWRDVGVDAFRPKSESESLEIRRLCSPAHSIRGIDYTPYMAGAIPNLETIIHPW